jgi:transcriptional regulator with XRE-family HTH domain
MNKKENDANLETIYTLELYDLKKEAGLTYEQIVEKSKVYDFSLDKLGEKDTVFIYEKGSQPSLDTLIGECFSTNFEINVHYFFDHPCERTKPHDHIPIIETFHDFDAAMTFAKKQIDEGMWEVTMQKDSWESQGEVEVKDLQSWDVYEYHDINEQLKELEYEKEKIEEKYFWAQDSNSANAEEYLDELTKINAQIEKEPAHE